LQKEIIDFHYTAKFLFGGLVELFPTRWVVAAWRSIRFFSCMVIFILPLSKENISEGINQVKFQNSMFVNLADH